ncbi:glycosyl hydrolase 2 galactose-binding domain-containing protein [Streptomyces griseicoloratus]|uniref:glycosyl hydrolase 2 galactose-binding domain-containing protein n=1 Tax=Streptomyces griseicoloratus TaxID=2752516 RepID=UPI00359C8B84
MTPCFGEHGGALLPARVPGCVHTDLLAAGLIPDPHAGPNERDVQWMGRRAWTYSRALDPEDTATGAHERVDLVFTGRHGGLYVEFASAYEEPESVRSRTGDRPNAHPGGPTPATAGMWRPVRPERWSTARLAGVRPLVTVAGGTGRGGGARRRRAHRTGRRPRARGARRGGRADTATSRCTTWT